MESRIKVLANQKERTLIIDFYLYFRQVAERALLRMLKPPSKEKQGKVELKKD